MARKARVEQNDPSRAGQLAGRKRIFGERSRYAVAPVHSRVNPYVEWFVWDAEYLDEITGLPAVIRQASCEGLAVHMLERGGAR